MASEIDVCNLALAHLGDDATVASIDPPEGSAQAEHCARFYPIARDALLELHSWGFASRRIRLALLSSGWPEWEYAYAQPADALNILAVLPDGVTDDYQPQEFACEIDDNGAQVIYTDQPDAALRYTALVTDTTRFSPLFVTALSWHLASMLAGPILKGETGAAESQRCAKMAQAYLAQAKESDANQRRARPTHTPPWLGVR